MNKVNINDTTLPKKKTNPLSPCLQLTSYKKTISEQREAGSNTTKRGFCKRLSDCLVMGPAISNRIDQNEHSVINLLERQVQEMKKEVEKHRETTEMYGLKLEKTQGYLQYCLQVAQDNGFLDLIILPNNIEHSIITISQNPEFNSDLHFLIHQAKINGWYIDPHEIETQHLSTQGTTADIYKGKWRGLDVAVKCMFPDFFHSNENGISFFMQEIETLSRQRHPFVLHLIGVSIDPPDNCLIVTEFFSSNLKDWLHGPGKRQKERTIDLPEFHDRISKALEISLAMQYLHESKPKIIHRDLKPSNIFLDDALHVRVADFGHARYLIDGEKALTGETGTFVYMAPEVIKSSPYDEKCDVYSFGIILNELVTGEYPYVETDYGPSKVALEVAENVLRPSMDGSDEKLEELNKLIRQSWDQEPEARPTFAEITSNLRIIMKKLRHEY